MSSGRTAFQIGFEISPIILTGGIAALIPGQMLPIIAITQAPSFALGLLQGNINLNPDTYFARFKPIPGATMANNQIGQYPFANQTVAANAIISQPLNVSMAMICPVKDEGGYPAKLATMSALQKSLDLHSASGGTYTVVTPSFIYTNCILLGMRDATSGDHKQSQIEWHFDFVKPLIALDTAQSVANSLMSKLSSQLPIDGAPTWSGLATSVSSTIGGAIGSLIPASSGLAGSLTLSSLPTTGPTSP